MTTPRPSLPHPKSVPTERVRRLALAAILAPGLAAGARAGLDGPLPMPRSPAYVAECGGCHTAYAPGLLPARSWRALMAGLERHFGSDAGLDPDLRDGLLAQVLELAGDGPWAHPELARRNAGLAAAEVPLRVTGTPFFRYLHDEVPAGVWRRPGVASRANCGACHPGADAGRYLELEIRIPK